MKNTFHVTLLEHPEGVSVSCPELPGCHSQGSTVDEAMENIRDAFKVTWNCTVFPICIVKSANWK